MILSASTVHLCKPFSSNTKGEKPLFPLSSPNSSRTLPELDPLPRHESWTGMGQPGCRAATMSAPRSTLVAEHPDRQVALPAEPDSSWAHFHSCESS